MNKNIKLLSINDVKNFVNAASTAEFDIDLVSGRYTVDAKSIMGIFSLDLAKPIEIRVHAGDAEAAAFFESIKAFVV